MQPANDDDSNWLQKSSRLINNRMATTVMQDKQGTACSHQQSAFRKQRSRCHGALVPHLRVTSLVAANAGGILTCSIETMQL
jgi:hypothetical protein